VTAAASFFAASHGNSITCRNILQVFFINIRNFLRKRRTPQARFPVRGAAQFYLESH
jgi:hypothetical protein